MNKFDNTNGLDSPLVVHKKTDSSYQATASELELNATHEEDDNETLERHRFKKEKKNNKATPIILIILIVVGVLVALYFTGVIGNRNADKPVPTDTSSTSEVVTSIQEKYRGTIVVKGSDIFVDGYEVDGIEGLQSAIKYEDPSPTRYAIIQENIDELYYNNEILPILSQLGFYDKSTQVSVVHSTGLMAEDEQPSSEESVSEEALLEETVSEETLSGQDRLDEVIE